MRRFVVHRLEVCRNVGGRDVRGCRVSREITKETPAGSPTSGILNETFLTPLDRGRSELTIEPSVLLLLIFQIDTEDSVPQMEALPDCAQFLVSDL